MPRLYLNSDASTRKEYHTSGVHVIIKNSSHKKIFEKSKTYYCADNNLAELFGIYTVLKEAEKLPLFSQVQEILLYSDCQNALNRSTHRIPPRTMDEKLCSDIWALVEKFQKKGKKISFCWVKGHNPQNKSDPNTVSNIEADMKAKQIRKIYEQDIQFKKHLRSLKQQERA